MTSEDRVNLTQLLEALRSEQTDILLATARKGGKPSDSTLQRVAKLELTIAAIEHNLGD